MKLKKYCSFLLVILIWNSSVKAQSLILKPADFKHYIESFNKNDNELYRQYYPNTAAWDFLKINIPLFDCPDKQLEQTYYFRWWTFRKHIRKTADGFIITEFLPDVPWAGKYNSINCAAGHHIYEGRWLHDATIIKDYINFWFYKGGNLRSYSTWLADAIFKYASTKGDTNFLKKLQPDLVANFNEWEKSHCTNEGLFWSVDDRDGMEISVSGNGLRPTLNSYMYADAKAISAISAIKGDHLNESIFTGKAATLKKNVLEKLWDKKDKFFKVIPLKDQNGEVDTQQPFSIYNERNVRELLGYTPWYVNMPDPAYAAAWQQLFKKDGFAGTHGLTTTEQRNAGFTIAYKDHECQWNGPSWPFATSITLTGMANLLHNQSQPFVSKKDYLSLLLNYSRAHTITTDDGRQMPWIDENLNPVSGDWISRTRLKTWQNGTWAVEKGGQERGKDYNHSTFCDLVISGLIGLNTRITDTLTINPLVPVNTWDYFCLDNVLYHGKILTILYDKTGKRYKSGKGLIVFIDGKKVASAKNIHKIIYAIK